ncbi:hypothetical protein DPMN_135436 [Dreissena polymorpha]|uniref:Uncharacterized protein n=1 Tax=Dreissena polymorpha TaxID=45954 RepID=A0A9D4G1V2_DREPO|nr:hypothetical protein DPMN_135436 [Dreissena polymorpha]
MSAGKDRIAKEMSRHTRMLERQNELLDQVTTVVLQVRDNLDRFHRRKENSSFAKSVAKPMRKWHKTTQ